jgi:predicted nucleic acid-binding Zn ribbon protein
MAFSEPTPEEREQWELAQIKQSNSRLFARPIGSVMRKLLSEKGYGAIESAQEMLDAWPAMVGERLAKVTRPGRVAKGVLLVEVANSQALQEIHFEKTKILKAIQRDLPAHQVTDLRFRIVTH